jgi:hypothetical protein
MFSQLLVTLVLKMGCSRQPFVVGQKNSTATEEHKFRLQGTLRRKFSAYGAEKGVKKFVQSTIVCLNVEGMRKKREFSESPPTQSFGKFCHIVEFQTESGRIVWN